MTTQDIVEALLFINPSARKYLTSAHVISRERNWQPKQHDEFIFMKHFTDPKYLVFIDEQVHVYIIGAKENKRLYNVLNIEGFSVDHYVLTKSDLREMIKNTLKETQYLPLGNKRIYFMYKDEIYVFNRLDNKKFLSKANNWTIGAKSIYDPSCPKYSFSFDQVMTAIEDSYDL